KLGNGEVMPLRWSSLHMACVVLAAAGYPEAPEKDALIEGDVDYQSASSYFLHAGTAKNAQGKWVTAGGRVLNAIGMGSTLREAVSKAYTQAKKATWKGQRMRQDIGAKIIT
ncbi:MAG: phosphoribosylglycinamide synthetase C domain-containing protein, partial [Bdellovibrionales bacterium]